MYTPARISARQNFSGRGRVETNPQCELGNRTPGSLAISAHPPNTRHEGVLHTIATTTEFMSKCHERNLLQHVVASQKRFLFHLISPRTASNQFPTEVVVNVRVALCDKLPLVPVMVIGKVPCETADVAVRVIVEEPPVAELGLKLASTPPGRPDAVRVTGALKPDERLIFMLVEVLPPSDRVNAGRAGDIAKSPTA